MLCQLCFRLQSAIFCYPKSYMSGSLRIGLVVLPDRENINMAVWILVAILCISWYISSSNLVATLDSRPQMPCGTVPNSTVGKLDPKITDTPWSTSASPLRVYGCEITLRTWGLRVNLITRSWIISSHGWRTMWCNMFEYFAHGIVWRTSAKYVYTVVHVWRTCGDYVYTTVPG